MLCRAAAGGQTTPAPPRFLHTAVMSVRRSAVFRTPKKAEADGDDSSSKQSPSSGLKRSAGAHNDCPLTKRIPVIQKTGNQVEDIKRESQRDDLKELIELMWGQPEYISQTLNFAKRLGKEKTTTSDSWPTSTPPNTIGQVPKTEILKFFAQIGVPPTFLDSANAKDSSILGQLFALALHVQPTLPLPESAKESAGTFWRWARARAKIVGRISMINKNLSSAGYNKVDGGAYLITWDAAGRATKVTHTATKDEYQLDSTFGITKEWNLQQWNYDLTATISRNKALKLQLSDVFKPAAGPYTLSLNKLQFERSVEPFTSPAAEADPPVVVHESGEQLMVKSRQAKADMLAERAKENFKKHREMKASRSTISLGPAPALAPQALTAE